MPTQICNKCGEMYNWSDRYKHKCSKKNWDDDILPTSKKIYERCAFCGKLKSIEKPCDCKYGGVFG